MTEKLYYQDVNCMDFTATVLSCTQSGNRWAVILDRTAFYPEGGGQPWDTGLLGGCQVLEVQEKEEEIIHYLDGPLQTGIHTTGQVDRERRFDLMQQHSGEHIVSGLIHAAYGCDNVGFHMGTDVITIDFNTEITMESLREIELQANMYIWEDRECHIWWPQTEELEQLPYRSKKELTGAVRLVEFPGADLCACCGTHVTSSGQIGLIRILSCVGFRRGVRIEMLCGKRALLHLFTMSDQNHAVSALTSARPAQTAAAVQRLLDENGTLKQQCAALENRLFTQQAEALRGAGNVTIFQDGLTPDSVRRLAAAIMETCGGRAAVFSGSDSTDYKYCIGHAGGDIRQLTREMNSALSGRGGGRPYFTQGSVQASRNEIEAFFADRS